MPPGFAARRWPVSGGNVYWTHRDDADGVLVVRELYDGLRVRHIGIG